MAVPLLEQGQIMWQMSWQKIHLSARCVTFTISISAIEKQRIPLYFKVESAVFPKYTFLLVAGLEPARCCHRGILSPLRLPIPPHQPTQSKEQANRPRLTFYARPCREMQMDGGGFEPPKQFAADLQSVPFGHSGIHPYNLKSSFASGNAFIKRLLSPETFFLS